MANAQSSLKSKWENMPSNTRSMFVLGSLAFIVLFCTYLFTKDEAKATTVKVGADETRFLQINEKDLNAELNASKTSALTDEVTKLKEQLAMVAADASKFKDQVNAEKNAAPTSKDAMLASRLDQLATQLAEVSLKKEKELDKPLPAATAPAPVVDLLPVGESNQLVASAEPVESPKIRIISEDKALERKKVKAEVKAPIAYLPSGSMFEVVLLNGMDAATNAVAQKNPVPALARVKADAILPNSFVHDIKECFALVAGYGSLSSERALMRTETLSCVREGGQVIEAKLDGYVVGEDGRVGMRGRLVSKQGQLIAKSLASGILSGFGQAVTPQSTPGLNLNSGTSYQMPDMGAIAQSSLGRGFSDASKSASQFFLEMAKEMTPVVEIDAGRKATIILTKGVELK